MGRRGIDSPLGRIERAVAAPVARWHRVAAFFDRRLSRLEASGALHPRVVVRVALLLALLAGVLTAMAVATMGLAARIAGAWA